MVKKFATILLGCLLAITSFAQSAGDKIIGTYEVIQGDDKSKVVFTKSPDNTYRCQVIWLEKNKDSKGNIRLDVKNPDETKRSTPCDKIVLIDKLTYNNGVWGEGKIYDPTRGKYFNVEVKFKDEETIAVKGSWAFFSQTVYWKRIKE